MGLFHIIKKKSPDSCVSTPFSLLTDESNDKTDNIILVRVLDPVVGEVCTRFLDMPVVNIAQQTIFF